MGGHTTVQEAAAVVVEADHSALEGAASVAPDGLTGTCLEGGPSEYSHGCTPL